MQAIKDFTLSKALRRRTLASEVATDRVLTKPLQIAPGNSSEDHLESFAFKRGIKRERLPLSNSSSIKSPKKTEPLKSDCKSESFMNDYCHSERLKTYQSLLEEVYLYGSSPKSDSAQSGSPKTPTLKHSVAQDLGEFMDSIANLFPSEYQDLTFLLDIFQERRCSQACICCTGVSHYLGRTTAICMRISNFFDNLNTKHEKSGLAELVKQFASRFQEFGSKVSSYLCTLMPISHSSFTQSGRSATSKAASPFASSQHSQKNQRAQYVAEIKKSLNPGVSVAHQMFHAAEARLKM